MDPEATATLELIPATDHLRGGFLILTVGKGTGMIGRTSRLVYFARKLLNRYYHQCQL